MSTQNKYIVTIHSGMANERDEESFDSYMKAIKYVNKNYESDEIESLDINICFEDNSGQRSYEI